MFDFIVIKIQTKTMDSEAGFFFFLGQAPFQLSHNLLAKLIFSYKTAAFSPATVNAFKLHLISNTAVTKSQNQTPKFLMSKAIMLMLNKPMKHSTLS